MGIDVIRFTKLSTELLLSWTLLLKPHSSNSDKIITGFLPQAAFPTNKNQAHEAIGVRPQGQGCCRQK